MIRFYHAIYYWFPCMLLKHLVLITARFSLGKWLELVWSSMSTFTGVTCCYTLVISNNIMARSERYISMVLGEFGRRGTAAQAGLKSEESTPTCLKNNTHTKPSRQLFWWDSRKVFLGSEKMDIYLIICTIIPGEMFSLFTHSQSMPEGNNDCSC